PLGICTDKLGNIYVADTYNNAIRMISTTGVVTTIGGKGTDSAGFRNGADSLALFNLPVGVAIDAAGTLYVADNGNNVVRKIYKGTVSTFAGNDTIGYRDGADSIAEFNDLGGIAVDDSGYVYVTEFGNNSVRKISKGYVVNIGGYDTLGIDTTDLSTYPGYKNGAADTSIFNSPVGIVVDHSGNVFVCDEYNNVIREISNGVVTTFAGNDSLVIPGFVNGPLDTAEFFQPVGIALDKYGAFYIGDNGNNVVRRIGAPPLGIATITPKKLNMQVYPNPCNQQTYIASAPSGVAELLDLTGRVVWTNEHFKAPASLATDNISPGVYFLRIQSGMQSATTKIVVQH
ncbi:MAG TPA: T9SS type A sorting domain-containing protein, partial [Bacteroidia bacterium]|nr:T9SS type A sorting domain-containing protein [Bacteroidia bacterium]